MAVELTVDEWTVVQWYAKDLAEWYASIAKQGIVLPSRLVDKLRLWLKTVQMRECA